jgi:hypothetical protein
MDIGRIGHSFMEHIKTGLSSGVQFSLFKVACASADEDFGVYFDYMIFVSDGTNKLRRFGSIVISAVNEAGTISTGLSTGPNPQGASSPRSLTFLPAVSGASGEVTMKMTLTPNNFGAITTFTIKIWIRNCGPQALTLL